MTAPNSADYERGWRDAIDATNPPGTAERSAANAAVTGLIRRFSGALSYVAADMDRIARAMAALDVEPDEARRVEDAAWYSIWLQQDMDEVQSTMTEEQRRVVDAAVEREMKRMHAATRPAS